MKATFLINEFVCRDPKIAKLLARPDSLAIINVIGDGACTARDIADAIDWPVKRTWYRLKVLATAGILRRDGERLRGGRPQPLYRVAAERFVIPAEWRDHTIGMNYTRRLRATIERSGLLRGEEIFWNGSRFSANRLPDPDGQNSLVIDLWLRANLSPSDIQGLEGELRSLLGSYGDRQSAGRRPYLINIAAAPRGAS